VKRDAEKRPLVRKFPNGKVWASTPDIAAFCGRSRHDNFTTAVRKARDADPEFGKENYRDGTYTTKNNQTEKCFFMTREGFVRMCRKMHGMRDHEGKFLDAYDMCEYENRKRLQKAEPIDLDPAAIPDDPAALEPGKPTIVLDLGKEPGGPEEHARRIIEVSGSTETPELMAKILHAMPPAPLPGGPLQPLVFADGDERFTVRMISLNGKFWWVAKDACAALDLAGDASQHVRRLDADEKDLIPIQTPGGLQAVLAVNEAGLYTLILRSDKPRAKRFKRWVTHEVLPQIRQAGGYGPQADPPAGRGLSLHDLLADPDALLSLALGYAGQVKTLSTENTKLETQVSVLEPKAAALDRLADKNGTMNLRSAAKALGFGPDFFKRRLEQLDYLFREDGRLVAYQKHIDAGLFTHRPVVLSHRDGTEYVVSQPLVTARGLAKLAVAFGVGVQAVLGQGVLGLRSDGEAMH
jgi:anti-repressor protein